MRTDAVESPAARRPRWRKLARLAIAAVLSLMTVLMAWTLVAIRARPEARAALLSDASVSVVEAGTHVTFLPTRSPSGAGLLFVAGALVDPVSYAPILRRIAEAGYPGILVKLPRRGLLGGLGGADVLTRGRSAMAATRVERWVIAAHSRGGGVAARLAKTNDPTLAALVLIGSSDPRDFSLAATSLAVTQIYGTHDTVERVEQIERALGNLPASTRRIRIDGGNHSQFAYYGLQPGDWPAGIGREEQQQVVMHALLDVLARAER